MKKPTQQSGYDTHLRLMEVTEDPLYMQEYQQKSVKSILFDKWRNEWDDMADFGDMDFRTVDDQD
ncbi:MAG: hypothetical protein FD165_2216 [Gammaproteobacteria bacterium]|nr:MAG: hypothetical protein FD165_2216 [Gammaproteobacteria bacterium]TND03260.1 MAG: hypothetical protein FD120_1933 [Gammaproteobacteria bacterium]